MRMRACIFLVSVSHIWLFVVAFTCDCAFKKVETFGKYFSLGVSDREGFLQDFHQATFHGGSSNGNFFLFHAKPAMVKLHLLTSSHTPYSAPFLGMAHFAGEKKQIRIEISEARVQSEIPEKLISF